MNMSSGNLFGGKSLFLVFTTIFSFVTFIGIADTVSSVFV